jgi:hypothetical protein
MREAIHGMLEDAGLIVVVCQAAEMVAAWLA